MVSGIGPQDVLMQHDISVLADRPGVGQNMWVCDDRQMIAASHHLAHLLIMHLYSLIANVISRIMSCLVQYMQ